MKVLTSNVRKIAELKAIGIPIEIFKGPDIPEVMDDDLETVIAYKSLDAGPFMLVEDTILIVNGTPLVDVKFHKQFEQHEGQPAEWVVSLAYHDQQSVYIFTGITKGTMVVPNSDTPKSFGFNRFFKPEGCDATMADLLGEGEYPVYEGKSEYLNISARRKAVELFNVAKPTRIMHVRDLPKWTGEYQS